MTEKSKKQRIFHQHLEQCLCNENLYCPTIHPSTDNCFYRSLLCHWMPQSPQCLERVPLVMVQGAPSHPARRVSTYWLCTSSCNSQSRACGKLSTLLIHFGHLQFKSLIQHFSLCFTIPLCAQPAVLFLPRSSSGVLLSAATPSLSFSSPRCFSSIGHFYSRL